jgi:hypothetical protein
MVGLTAEESQTGSTFLDFVAGNPDERDSCGFHLP